MKHYLLKGFAAFAAFSAIFVAAAPAQAEWREAKSENFTVIGDMPEADLRRWSERLEQYHGMLQYLLDAKRTVPVTLYVLDGLGAVQRAGGSRSIAGFYSATAQSANAVVPERFNFDRGIEDFNPRIVLLHEYAHHMLLTNVEMFMPGWAQEGLAEMFATAKFEADGSVVIGDKNDSRGGALFGMSRWSVRRMLESDFNPPKRDEAIEKYARGWALAHYLWMSGERPNQYGDFIAELNRTIDPVASGEKVFGDLGRLDRELDRYIRAHKFKLARFSPDLIGTPGEITFRTLSEGEAAMLDFRLVSTLGVTEEQARSLVERARPVAARYPDNVPVQTWIAEMEYDAKNYDASWAAAERALALDPNSMFGMVYKGRVLMRRAIAAGSRETAQEARTWFRKANRADPNHALPFQLYYDSFAPMGEKPPADAVEGLLHATVLVPQDGTLRVRSAIELLREGNVVQARSILAPVAFQAEGIGENPPLKLIREMENTQDSQALLAKATELKLDRVNEFIEQPDEDEDDKEEAVRAPAAER
jgi:tetratricopeptide (TPR) repeat protein